MSYIRNGYPLEFVEGDSNDYVFETGDEKKSYIEDYGGMNNETIVELLLRFGKSGDNLILTQMGKRLAENLNIKLRDANEVEKE